MNAIVLCVETFFKNSKKSLLNITLIVLTVGLEEIVFSAIAFSCPCTGHRTYGTLFLLAPAVLLFLIGILINNDTWYYSRAALWNRADKSTQAEALRIPFKHIAEKLLDVLAHASVAPAVWLILSLLQKMFLVCALFGPSLVVPRKAEAVEHVANITDSCSPAKPRVYAEELRYITESQILGWCIMIMLLVVIICHMCITRCLVDRKVGLPDAERCMEIEAKEAMKQFKEAAQQLAMDEGAKRVKDMMIDQRRKSEKAGKSNYKKWIEDVAQELTKIYGSAYKNARARAEKQGTTTDKVNGQSTTDETDGGEGETKTMATHKTDAGANKTPEDIAVPA